MENILVMIAVVLASTVRIWTPSTPVLRGRVDRQHLSVTKPGPVMMSKLATRHIWSWNSLEDRGDTIFSWLSKDRLLA